MSLKPSATEPISSSDTTGQRTSSAPSRTRRIARWTSRSGRETLLATSVASPTDTATPPTARTAITAMRLRMMAADAAASACSSACARVSAATARTAIGSRLTMSRTASMRGRTRRRGARAALRSPAGKKRASSERQMRSTPKNMPAATKVPLTKAMPNSCRSADSRAKRPASNGHSTPQSSPAAAQPAKVSTAMNAGTSRARRRATASSGRAVGSTPACVTGCIQRALAARPTTDSTEKPRTKKASSAPPMSTPRATGSTSRK